MEDKMTMEKNQVNSDKIQITQQLLEIEHRLKINQKQLCKRLDEERINAFLSKQKLWKCIPRKQSCECGNTP